MDRQGADTGLKLRFWLLSLGSIYLSVYRRVCFSVENTAHLEVVDLHGLQAGDKSFCWLGRWSE